MASIPLRWRRKRALFKQVTISGVGRTGVVMPASMGEKVAIEGILKVGTAGTTKRQWVKVRAEGIWRVAE
jgi:hypothetical protein